LIFNFLLFTKLLKEIGPWKNYNKWNNFALVQENKLKKAKQETYFAEKSWSENSMTQIISPVEPPRCQRDAKDAILGSVGPAIIRQISDTHEYQKGQRATQGNNFNQTGAVLHGVYNWIFTYSYICTRSTVLDMNQCNSIAILSKI
jgi:hypothetical protein